MQKKMYRISFYFTLILANTTLIINAQNVGIGTTTPSTPLHIKGTTDHVLKIEGNHPYLSLTDLTDGYRGYLWYTGNSIQIGTAALSGLPVTIAPNVNISTTFAPGGNVGINKTNPTEKLDVGGNINLSGMLKLNGNPGAAGQVLTSNGSGAPQWKTTAYGDNIRFGMELIASTSDLNVRLQGIYYNQSTGDVGMSIGSNIINIYQSGLYHFDLAYSGQISGSGFTSTPEFNLDLYVTGTNSYLFHVCRGKELPWRSFLSRWFLSDLASFDLFISAPSQLQFTRNFYYIGTPTSTFSEVFVKVFGYRISP